MDTGGVALSCSLKTICLSHLVYKSSSFQKNFPPKSPFFLGGKLLTTLAGVSEVLIWAEQYLATQTILPGTGLYCSITITPDHGGAERTYLRLPFLEENNGVSLRAVMWFWSIDSHTSYWLPNRASPHLPGSVSSSTKEDGASGLLVGILCLNEFMWGEVPNMEV